MSNFAKASTRMLQLAACIILMVHWTSSVSAEGVGRFEGELVLKVLPDGRNMELAGPFRYIDSHNVAWPVPAGSRVDGASIPSVFWSLIGAPYTGKYREASVIHDYYCETRSRHWKAVHRVFLDGMLARGVNKLEAQLMYLAVYRFGPRWDFDVDACFCKGCPSCANPKLRRVAKYDPRYKSEDFEELSGKLKSGQFTLEQLEDAADYQLNTEILKSR
ncbi:DUF1353 domain-containing protein [Bradyrhizobium sp. ERR14]|uniref:DUF1353 domain-containing protein n=1 Tax=Bradyrhizobium sp. ERR14 TaxID=2663837 RepID=UPI001617ECDA|nr:DUF1353 domain-containing protein [Bradyrhizobium sp. ERR14]MBB4398792.1 hypothetical protein [Bradyrhizobium sp. ERR14]